MTNDDIGDVLLTQGDLSGAIAAFKSSFDIKQDLAKAAPDDAGRQRDLTVVYDEIGDVQRDHGQWRAGARRLSGEPRDQARARRQEPG